MRASFAAALLLTAGCLALPSLARAQDEATADLAFWQSIREDKDPAELKAYLSAFPNGRFAPIARIQLGKLGAAAAPGPAENPAGVQGQAEQRPIGHAPFQIDLVPKMQGAGNDVVAQPAPAGDDADTDPPILPEQITVSPARGRVGQIIQFTCLNFPDPLGVDKIVVVPAGTPEMDPTRNPADTKIVWSDYATNCKRDPVRGGPFPPGRYEVRFMTGLYNVEHSYQVKARADLVIR